MQPVLISPFPQPRSGARFVTTVTPDNQFLTVFVNERQVQVPPRSSARDAVRAHDPSLLQRVEAGEGYLTDGRGIRLVPESPVPPGGIIRVVISARRPAEPDADT